MEDISAVHLHIPHMISFWTFVHGKCRDIGKKKSNNKKASCDSHIHFLPPKERELSAEILNL